MRQVIGVVVTCPHCHKQHVETLANAKLEKVHVDPKGTIIEMAVVADTPEVWVGSDINVATKRR